ncbi:MAG: DUF2079 domain-containing protein [Cyanobium sp.]
MLWTAALALAFTGLRHAPLRDWDEAIVARVALELSRHPWAERLPPTYAGQPYLNKPPGLHWLIAGLIDGWRSHQGEAPLALPPAWVVRLAPALASTLLIPLLGLVQWQLRPGREGAALATSLITLTLLPLARHAHLSMLDGTQLSALALLWLGLLLAQGDNNLLSINIRYTLLVVPGLFAGTILWWQRHPQAWRSRRLRRIWAPCLALSLLFTLTGNPNRSFSWLNPDSVQPWVYSSPLAQWHHGQEARRALELILAGASVSATTPLVPHLAQREVLVRFPDGVTYLDRTGQARQVDWIAVDLDWFRRYGVQTVRDGVAILQRGRADNPAARRALAPWLES